MNGGLALVVAAALATPAAGVAVAQEAGRTCNGQPVTIAFDDPGVGTNITGTEGPDVILGGRDSEVIKGRGGEDVVCGGDGADRIDGGSGRDKLLGQGDSDSFSGADLGLDQINGGSAKDVAGYGLLPAGIGVQVNSSNEVVHQDGAPVNGRIVSVESVQGTSSADVLVGDADGDRLDGRGGDDVLDGRGDEDLLDGGPGRDRVSFATATAGVKVDLLQQLARAGAVEDTLQEIEGAIGSPHADRLVGTGTNDEFDGGGGDDTIKGKGGDDILLGGNGDDVLFPGPGDDDVDGGANDPVTSSGEHGDLVSYQGDTLDVGATHLEVVLYFFAPTNNPPYVSGVGEDVLGGVESARGVKNRQNTFAGTDGPNVLIGGDGQDFMVGRGGNDLIYGLSGVDTINGDYPAHSNDALFGDDYLDGGAPTGGTPDGHGGGDADRVNGNLGNDTCTGAVDDGDYLQQCETVF